MKWSARDMLEILRFFAVAGPENVPRNVEHLKSHHVDDFSTIFGFSFLKRQYYVVVDSEIDDNATMAQHAIVAFEPNKPFEVLQNPTDDPADFATRFKGKMIYLLREAKTSTRLDSFLSESHPELSRSAWQKHIKAGNVTVNGNVVTSPKTAVETSDLIETAGTARPDFSSHTLPVIYEDDNVIVVDKPAGVLTHSKGVLNDEFTVADFFAPRTSVSAGTNRPGIIHRLDRDTSGVIIGAKNDETATKLKKQFSDRTVKKSYVAVLEKAPQPEKGIISVPIGRNPSAPSTFRPDPNGKPAETMYETLVINDETGHALVRFRPRTGRTHQLRVHAAFLGTPILGDRVYGRKGERLFLHAHQLEVTIPESKREVFISKPSADFLVEFSEVEL